MDALQQRVRDGAERHAALRKYLKDTRNCGDEIDEHRKQLNLLKVELADVNEAQQKSSSRGGRWAGKQVDWRDYKMVQMAIDAIGTLNVAKGQRTETGAERVNPSRNNSNVHSTNDTIFTQGLLAGAEPRLSKEELEQRIEESERAIAKCSEDIIKRPNVQQELDVLYDDVFCESIAVLNKEDKEAELCEQMLEDFYDTDSNLEVIERTVVRLNTAAESAAEARGLVRCIVKADNGYPVMSYWSRPQDQSWKTTRLSIARHKFDRARSVAESMPVVAPSLGHLPALDFAQGRPGTVPLRSFKDRMCVIGGIDFGFGLGGGDSTSERAARLAARTERLRGLVRLHSQLDEWVACLNGHYNEMFVRYVALVQESRRRSRALEMARQALQRTRRRIMSHLLNGDVGRAVLVGGGEIEDEDEELPDYDAFA